MTGGLLVVAIAVSREPTRWPDRADRATWWAIIQKLDRLTSSTAARAPRSHPTLRDDRHQRSRTPLTPCVSAQWLMTLPFVYFGGGTERWAQGQRPCSVRLHMVDLAGLGVRKVVKLAASSGTERLRTLPRTRCDIPSILFRTRSASWLPCTYMVLPPPRGCGLRPPSAPSCPPQPLILWVFVGGGQLQTVWLGRVREVLQLVQRATNTTIPTTAHTSRGITALLWAAVVVSLF